MLTAGEFLCYYIFTFAQGFFFCVRFFGDTHTP